MEQSVPEPVEGHLAQPLKCYDPFLVGNKIAENQYDDFDGFLADVDMVVIMLSTITSSRIGISRGTRLYSTALTFVLLKEYITSNI